MIAQQGHFTVCRNIMGVHGAVIDEVFKEITVPTILRTPRS
jgi:hypothetical protein